jgi:hypothetical protein
MNSSTFSEKIDLSQTLPIISAIPSQRKLKRPPLYSSTQSDLEPKPFKENFAKIAIKIFNKNLPLNHSVSSAIMQSIINQRNAQRKFLSHPSSPTTSTELLERNTTTMCRTPSLSLLNASQQQELPQHPRRMSYSSQEHSSLSGKPVCLPPLNKHNSSSPPKQQPCAENFAGLPPPDKHNSSSPPEQNPLVERVNRLPPLNKYTSPQSTTVKGGENMRKKSTPPPQVITSHVSQNISAACDLLDEEINSIRGKKESAVIKHFQSVVPRGIIIIDFGETKRNKKNDEEEKKKKREKLEEEKRRKKKAEQEKEEKERKERERKEKKKQAKIEKERLEKEEKEKRKNKQISSHILPESDRDFDDIVEELMYISDNSNKTTPRVSEKLPSGFVNHNNNNNSNSDNNNDRPHHRHHKRHNKSNEISSIDGIRTNNSSPNSPDVLSSSTIDSCSSDGSSDEYNGNDDYNTPMNSSREEEKDGGKIENHQPASGVAAVDGGVAAVDGSSNAIGGSGGVEKIKKLYMKVESPRLFETYGESRVHLVKQPSNKNLITKVDDSDITYDESESEDEKGEENNNNSDENNLDNDKLYLVNLVLNYASGEEEEDDNNSNDGGDKNNEEDEGKELIVI